MLDLPVVGDLKVPVVGHLLCVGGHLLSASSVTRLSVVAATLDQVSVALQSSDIPQQSEGPQGGEIGMGRGVALTGGGMLETVRGGSFVPCTGTLLGDVITKEVTLRIPEALRSPPAPELSPSGMPLVPPRVLSVSMVENAAVVGAAPQECTLVMVDGCSATLTSVWVGVGKGPEQNRTEYLAWAGTGA